MSENRKQRPIVDEDEDSNNIPEIPQLDDYGSHRGHVTIAPQKSSTRLITYNELADEFCKGSAALHSLDGEVDLNLLLDRLTPPSLVAQEEDMEWPWQELWTSATSEMREERDGRQDQRGEQLEKQAQRRHGQQQQQRTTAAEDDTYLDVVIPLNAVPY